MANSDNPDSINTGNNNSTETGNNINRSTSELRDELKLRELAEERLIKLGQLLEIAESRNIIIPNARTMFYSSRNKLYGKNNGKNDVLESINESDKCTSILTAALNKEKYRFLGFPKWTYISFVMAKYGLFSLFYGMISAIFFWYILLASDMDIQINIYKYSLIDTTMDINPYSLILNVVPLWAALIAGLGASVQIMVGTVMDIKQTGVVQEYKRLWYTALPFIATIFGFIAYILTDLGAVSITGSDISFLNATNISGNITINGLNQANLINNNTSLTALGATNLTAQSVEKFETSIGDNTRMAICFLVGYATNAFIDKLDKLAKKL